MDLCMKGRAHARSYRDLIVALRDVGVPSLTHAAAIALPKNSEYLAIRHDVDHRLDRALKMARIEREEGVRATYYLLPPGDYDSTSNYYGRIIDGQIYASAELAEGAMELQSLGHEVGLHNDFLQLSTLLRRPVGTLIREEVAYFASIGIPVVGSASHGSAFARTHGFTNYEIFAETKEKRQARTIDLGKHGSFELFSIPMVETGLKYEAYWLPRQIYISDTGSVLTAGYHRTQDASLSWLLDNIGGARRIAALVHADWWDDAPEHPELGAVLAARQPALPVAVVAAAAASAETVPAPDLTPTPVIDLPTAAEEEAEAEAEATLSVALDHVTSGLLHVAASAHSDAGSETTPADIATDPVSEHEAPALQEPTPVSPVVATAPEDENPSRATLGDYGGFLATLLARGDVEFVTYDDLAWEDDFDHVNSFPGEWERWKRRVRADKDMQKKVHVLIQHDTDSGPAETLAMARLEAAFGVRSSIMTFARRPLRVGEPAIEDYAIDWDGLQSLAQQGFVVGYHCNALHLTNFDEERAPQAFDEDLVALARRGFRIDYFTAHGGASSPSGVGNSAIDYPALTGSRVRWVNTRFGARFDGYISDGGKGSNLSGVKRFSDLRDFVAGMRPGKRYRILVHAQYFEPTDMRSAMCLLPPWPPRAVDKPAVPSTSSVREDVSLVPAGGLPADPVQQTPLPAAPPQNPGRATLGDYGGFLATLLARGDVEFITYDDLPWEDDVDHVNSFPSEWERWRRRVRADKDMQKKVHVLIQHDTDSGPAETLAMARLEAAFGVRSSIMTFARRPLRVGEPAIEDYAIDWDGLQSLVQQGFVVGYHCNALHLTNFDEDGAPQAFNDDLAALARRGFGIDYFTAHGGPSSPTGMGNSAIDYPGLTGSAVRWVNTRFSPRFDGYFSDGGKGSHRGGVERFNDLREFVASMRPGGRYRILVHAQYFEPIDTDAALCMLPPWPPRPAATMAAESVKAFKVSVHTDRSPAGRFYDAARERARRVFGGTGAWRVLSHLVNTPGRVRRLEDSIRARQKEAEALKAQVDALREKNQTLYRRTVEYADRIQRLNAAAAKHRTDVDEATRGR